MWVVHVSLGTFPSAPVTGKLSTALLVAPLLTAAAFPAPTWAKLLLPGVLIAFHTLPACLTPPLLSTWHGPSPWGQPCLVLPETGKKTPIKADFET